jgi:hypothetical protein
VVYRLSQPRRGRRAEYFRRRKVVPPGDGRHSGVGTTRQSGNIRALM